MFKHFIQATILFQHTPSQDTFYLFIHQSALHTIELHSHGYPFPLLLFPIIHPTTHPDTELYLPYLEMPLVFF